MAGDNPHLSTSTMHRRIEDRKSSRTTQEMTVRCVWLFLAFSRVSDGFTILRQPSHSASPNRRSNHQRCRRSFSTFLYQYAPPGSGYATADDEPNFLPDTYEPMMEYPGTMRPGRTPENAPFHDLPIGDDDPEPVPWPYFQQIEWHHRWAPSSPHPTPMEDFIEEQGRWATPEQEAMIRAGNRRDVAERREQEATTSQGPAILDDDDDEPDDIPVDIGDGIFGQAGSIVSQREILEAVQPPPEGQTVEPITKDEVDNDDFNDFLMDLGLDDLAGTIGDAGATGTDDGTDTLASLMNTELDTLPPPPPGLAEDMDDDDIKLDLNLDLGLDDGTVPDIAPTGPQETATSDFGIGKFGDSDDDESPEAAATAIESDDELDMDIPEDEEDLSGDGMSLVPLEDFGDDSLMEDEDVFDDGGFDYGLDFDDTDDYGDGGDDGW